MINITKKKNCCGCGACAQSCVKNCISMEPDEEGFLYPSVDQERCVQCGACDRACPIGNRKSVSKPILAAYAAYAEDKRVREESSSGGIFSLLAQWVLRRGGTAFGAAFAEDFSVHHVMIRREEDLPKLRGSKYLQSRIEDTYREAKRELDAGRMVLFSGVACQISGLKSYLNKEYDNLYTVDVLCHGVPSPAVWQKYLQEQKKTFGSQIDEISFRSKEHGWNDYCVELTFQDGQVYRQSHSEDAFMGLFLGNICLRPSCHDCRFKGNTRVSDLTIGDAWGIDQQMPDMDDDKGTSVVLVNTPKGQILWQELGQMECRTGEAQTLLAGNSAYWKSVAAHPKRAKFFSCVDNGASIEELARLARPTPWQRMLSWGKRTVKKMLKV